MVHKPRAAIGTTPLELHWGVRVWCVMGTEQLNSAAWAAGFAMAASEDEYEDGCAVVQPVETQWTPGWAIMVRERDVERADWLRALLGLFGRRVRVSPA
jgi:hypothetical protein